jgi:hypothetical protein
MSEDAVKVHPVIDDSYQNIKALLEKARSTAYRAVNFAIVQAYWEIGRVIVEQEQKGAVRAKYGKALIKELSRRLTRDYGRGFTESNLKYMRQFYLTFPNSHALRAELTRTHYRLLLKVEKEEARDFYVRYFEKEERLVGDNPSIGLILCSDKNETMVRYTLLEDSKRIFASKYKLYLPTEEELKKELEREREMLEMEKRLGGG